MILDTEKALKDSLRSRTACESTVSERVKTEQEVKILQMVWDDNTWREMGKTENGIVIVTTHWLSRHNGVKRSDRYV